MAKRDFAAGVLQGLYNSGVGNPDVRRENEKQNLETAFKQRQLDIAASEQGLRPVPQEDPFHSRIGDFVRDVFGVNNPKTLSTAYERDPNAPRVFVDSQGNTSPTAQPGYFELTGNKARDYATKSALQPTVNIVTTDAGGNPVSSISQKKGQKVIITRPQVQTTASSAAETDKNARGRVSENLKTMQDLYNQLSNKGAIVDTSKGTFANIGSRISSSALGQSTGKAFGTETQSIRNQINQIKPLLIQDIRQASKMGARGLDSEKELAFYLQAATDPSIDIQTNLHAIQVLDRAYGLGLGIGEKTGTPSGSNHPAVGGDFNGKKIIKVEPLP